MSKNEFVVAKHLPTTYSENVLIFALFNRFAENIELFIILKNAFPEQHAEWIRYNKTDD